MNANDTNQPCDAECNSSAQIKIPLLALHYNESATSISETESA